MKKQQQLYFAPEVKDYLLLATSLAVRGVPLNVSLQEDVTLPLTGLALTFSGSAVEFDGGEEAVFYNDRTRGLVYKSHLDGTETTILTGYRVGMVDAMAYDWTSKVLFWTTSTYKTVVAFRVPDKSRRDIVTGLRNPKGIAVHPGAGYLFWSDWYRPAAIMRGFTDGSNAVPLVNTTLGWPYGLTVDYTYGGGEPGTRDPIKQCFLGSLSGRLGDAYRTVVDIGDRTRSLNAPNHRTNLPLPAADGSRRIFPVVNPEGEGGSDRWLCVCVRVDRLYWADALLDQIGLISIHGYDRRTFSNIGQITQPYGLTIHAEYLYVSHLYMMGTCPLQSTVPVRVSPVHDGYLSPSEYLYVSHLYMMEYLYVSHLYMMGTCPLQSTVPVCVSPAHDGYLSPSEYLYVSHLYMMEYLYVSHLYMMGTCPLQSTVPVRVSPVHDGYLSPSEYLYVSHLYMMEYLYVSDTRTKAVYRMRKRDGGDNIMIRQGVSGIMNVKAYSSDRQRESTAQILRSSAGGVSV
ncbi:Low-density lipoprotein receptor-related protein 2 [Merluccius polli]|uniref:Low-density lipoprotein receptor-related protein 2 n=1 Tax=Merluccius polli TaxID=89951 RepID=A0AA47MU16_MERPO|nr:Low-density lipoprotein receptor-related protein 2 [Merluccius polli]